MFPEIFLKAPSELTPVPFNVNASTPIVMLFDNCNAAPFATVTPPASVPRALLFVANNTPAETVVRPV